MINKNIANALENERFNIKYMIILKKAYIALLDLRHHGTAF